MFREPIGSFAVGVRHFETMRIGTGGYGRRVPITVYYPSDANSSMLSKTVEEPYRNPQWIKAKRDKVTYENNVHTYCYSNLPMRKKDSPYKAVIFNHGLNGYVMESTVLCADLASMGLIVFSMGHPYGGNVMEYSDGYFFEWTQDDNLSEKNPKKMLPLWEEDIIAVMDYIPNTEYSKYIDTKNYTLIGMSLGGNAAIYTGLNDNRVTSVVNMDGSLWILPKQVTNKIKIQVLCSRINIKAHLCLSEKHYTSLSVEIRKRLAHWCFCDGIYLCKKGQKNKEWADRETLLRANIICDFVC